MASAQELLSRGISLLAKGGVNSPALDASLLLANVLNITREKLYSGALSSPDNEQCRRFEEQLRRRQEGESVAYILGRREFWGLDFTVSPAVLVPRPDTEILVETALSIIDSRLSGNSQVSRLSYLPGNSLSSGFSRPSENSQPSGNSPGDVPAVLDLCTGSGAVAIAIKYSRPEVEMWAADLSEGALDIARLNAERLLSQDPPRGSSKPAPGDGGKIRFFRGDLFGALDQGRRFYLITANAPYVPSEAISRLSPELQREPRLALDGGKDGLDCMGRIIADAPEYLEARGVLLMEGDPSQMGALTVLLKKRGFTDITVHRDLAGLDRVIEGRLR
ncbi:MAG: peptide chain release factor N(5)-glutamine methyltransferase [Spirochaetaceae bacterium]|jgi:release factor glutamine methyltransferase|nr:peptide chain release factor N(5)-glutamine methyltransferase [Spirochaetaceae bacterium]